MLSTARCKQLLQIFAMSILAMLAVACSQQPVTEPDTVRAFDGMPVSFRGSWGRSYTRDDDVNGVLREAYNQLARTAPDQHLSRNPILSAPNQRDANAVLALARLAEEITRPDVLTISQSENEFRVDRKDDYSMLCTFYDGVAQGTNSPYGTEICGWDGDQLVSNLVLPDGLQVTHRFAISADGRQLRVTTTVSSRQSRVPFTLRRYYTKFNRPPPDFNCIETLSMKRVCSTGELNL